jgi:excisionase family DNA binding protein
MINDIFTVDQVAEILHLHPKTVRGFIREGKLMAKKIGKVWRIQKHDVDAFAGTAGDLTGSNVVQADGKTEMGVKATRGKIQVTAIIDFFVGSRDEADRISASIMASTKSKDSSFGDVRIDYIFYETEAKARFIVFGGAGFTSELLRMISMISD